MRPPLHFLLETMGGVAPYTPLAPWSLIPGTGSENQQKSKCSSRCSLIIVLFTYIWLIHLILSPLACNKTLTTNRGILTYQPSATSCFWNVQVTADHEIVLSFDRFFFGMSDDCKGTSLSVYDGSSASAPLTDTFCKLQSGESVKSTGNELFVRYNVEEYHDRIGFQLSYKTVAPGR